MYFGVEEFKCKPMSNTSNDHRKFPAGFLTIGIKPVLCKDQLKFLRRERNGNPNTRIL